MANIQKNISEIVNCKKMRPVHAEGYARFDLTDPITGKVKERIEGKNHVFTEALFSGIGFDWMSAISSSWLCLNTPNDTIDTTIPYLFGQTVGYGKPSTASSGTYRGAYNSANQVLAEMSLDNVRWKFQYDFTAAQINDVAIGTIGLTHQYRYVTPDKRLLKAFTTTQNSNSNYTCDGRYQYSCSVAGIIKKTDLWLNTYTTIDVSAIVGTATSSYKTVGYAPATGKYYIYVYSSTASLRRMYVFSNSSFTTLETTYSPTNVTGGTTNIYPLYIYGTVAYWFVTLSSISRYSYADFSSNIANTTVDVSTYNNASYTESTSAAAGSLGAGTCPLGSKYIYCSGDGSSSYIKGIIFDLTTGSVAGYTTALYTSTGYAVCKNPLTTEEIVCSTYGGYMYHKSAIAAKKLDTPVTKTSANGATATYELTVDWD